MEYEDYEFRLDWEELPEELREAKIEEVIERWIEFDPDYEDEDEEKLHRLAEEFIKSHFPICF